ncbi:MBL fold metallo-hydrolase [Magnetovibrio sp. PR-2]|uniref:MBL fold metallo-hydrolase n=1 Tax=Magnetovibrio sp. PR-2 TaxID=3120356 RepID=UPI002FCE4D03
MIFRQLFEPTSSTYTYVIGCEDSGQAILVDPVLETFARDLEELKALNLTLAYTLDTHVHADHLTSALKLKSITDCDIAMPSGANIACADVQLSEETPLALGTVELAPLFTPGHTDHHLSYRFKTSASQAVLTGDALLIDGCGRTDFQGGSSSALYRSIHTKLFTLPGKTLVYPGHDYKGRNVSSITQERTRNPRLKDGTEEEAFVQIMKDLDLAYPKKMDLAVPANMLCGQCPDTVPDEMGKLCEIAVQG